MSSNLPSAQVEDSHNARTANYHFLALPLLDHIHSNAGPTPSPFAATPAHDLESIYWVLTHLVIRHTTHNVDPDPTKLFRTPTSVGDRMAMWTKGWWIEPYVQHGRAAGDRLIDLRVQGPGDDGAPLTVLLEAFRIRVADAVWRPRCPPPVPLTYAAVLGVLRTAVVELAGGKGPEGGELRLDVVLNDELEDTDASEEISTGKQVNSSDRAAAVTVTHPPQDGSDSESTLAVDGQNTHSTTLTGSGDIHALAPAAPADDDDGVRVPPSDSDSGTIPQASSAGPSCAHAPLHPTEQRGLGATTDLPTKRDAVAAGVAEDVADTMTNASLGQKSQTRLRRNFSGERSEPFKRQRTRTSQAPSPSPVQKTPAGRIRGGKPAGGRGRTTRAISADAATWFES